MALPVRTDGRGSYPLRRRPLPYDPGVRRRIFPANGPTVMPRVVALDQPNGCLLAVGGVWGPGVAVPSVLPKPGPSE